MKLSLTQKLLLTNLLYIIPIIILTGTIYGTRSADIKFAETEIIGNIYQAPLETMLEDVSRHKILALREFNQNVNASNDLLAVRTKIEEDLKNLNEIDKKYGELLQFTTAELTKRKEVSFQYSKISDQWSEIKSKISSYKANDINESHSSLIANIRGMITHLGNSSNLILDPELDTYYLTDSTLGGLPQLQDRLQEIITFCEPLLQSKKISSDNKAQLLTYSVLLQSDLDRITGDIQTSLQENPNFHGISESLQKNLPPATKQLTDDIGLVIADLKMMGSEKDMPILATFLNHSENAIKSSYAQWFISEPENNILIGKRILDFKNERTTRLVTSIVVLFVASLASFFVSKSLRSSLMKSLAAFVEELRITASNTSKISSQIFENSQQLSDTSTQEAAATQQTVAALTEINAMMAKSNDNTVMSMSAIKQTQDAVTHGKSTFDSMIDSISSIQENSKEVLTQTEESNQKIGEIVRLMNEISSKTKVINDIVFQTKILSFNAAVESARAGEHGRGFAIVAEEVGNLARMSGTAAKEISDILEKSTHKVVSIIDETKSKVTNIISKGKIKVESGKQIAQDCKIILADILTSVHGVTDRFEEIANASHEQSRGIDEITKAMQSLDHLTTDNSKMANDANEFALTLKQESQKLLAVVENVQKEILGQKS